MGPLHAPRAFRYVAPLLDARPLQCAPQTGARGRRLGQSAAQTAECKGGSSKLDGVTPSTEHYQAFQGLRGQRVVRQETAPRADQDSSHREPPEARARSRGGGPAGRPGAGGAPTHSAGGGVGRSRGACWRGPPEARAPPRSSPFRLARLG
eukprot:7216693-Pyramimonas_sp.AAC.1